MDIPIQSMSLSEYAELQTKFGVNIINRDGRYWRRVRPFFYRPLLPVEAFPDAAMPSPVTWPSGFQYVVANTQLANSTMNFIMLEDLQNYSLDSLNSYRRRPIKRAAQQFEVRLLTDPRELKEQGHKVYLSFYDRTLYSYRADRILRPTFDHWVDTLFSNPKVIMLGGFGSNGLGAIFIGCWINHTLIYSSLMCETEALHRNLGELMFHTVRQMAGQEPNIHEILVRSYQSGNSLDQFYLLRGCKLVRRPARLEMPSTIQSLIRRMMPSKYALLTGDD